MYISSFEEPAAAREKYSARFSSRDYLWSDPIKTSSFVAKHPFIGGNQVHRKLKVRFSEDWPTFHARVKKAFGRFMVFRSDQGRAAEEQVEGAGIQALHEKLVADKANAKTFVVLPVKIFYLKRPSGEWLLNNYAFPVDFPVNPTWQWES